MTINKDKMEYRKKASGIILNSQNAMLLVQLTDYNDNEWNVPGGGIEEGESPDMAILRELKEELGTNKFELIEQSLIVNRYDFPDELIERIIQEGKNFRGQEQIQFIFRFKGEDFEIKLQEDEIRKHKWVPLEVLKSYLLFPNQLENILKVIESSSLSINS
ncbi:MAG: NUDIX domain-containing protein [Patescibacteria group bacterium]|nr:NUDIX domain-containing protein [Patescibacteria group bacterium]